MTLRKGYPTKRVIPDQGLIKKKKPYGRLLNRFMLAVAPRRPRGGRNNAQRFVLGCRMQLHATKGWRREL